MKWYLPFVFLLFFVKANAYGVSGSSTSSNSVGASCVAYAQRVDANTVVVTFSATGGSADTLCGYWLSSTADTTGIGTQYKFYVVYPGSSIPSDPQNYTCPTGTPIYLAAFCPEPGANSGTNHGSFLLVPDSDQPQTCTISNDGAPSVSGQTITGTASGAQGGNPYNISVVSGPASASINSATGAYTVTATGAGAISYKVWISAGNGYTRSNDATGGGTVGASKKVRVTLPANHGNYPIQYTLWQNGSSIGSYTQMPGNGAYILTIDVGADGGAVTVTSKVIGLTIDTNGNYIDDPSKETSTGIIDTVTPTADPNATAVDVTPPPANSSKAPAAPENKTPDVWKQSPQSTTDPTAQTDLLTNATFREGIGKLLDGGSAVTAGGPDALDTSPIPTQTANLTQGQVDDFISKLPSQPVLTPPPNGDSAVMSFGVALPFIDQTIDTTWTFDFSSWISPFAWVRELINGILMVFYYFAIVRTLRDSVAN